MLKEDERVAYQAAFNTFDWFVKTSIYCVNCPKIVHDNGCPGQIMVGWPTEACKMWWGELGWTRLILRLILSNRLTTCTFFALIRNAETTDTMVIGPPCNIGFSYQTSQRSQVSRVPRWACSLNVFVIVFVFIVGKCQLFTQTRPNLTPREAQQFMHLYIGVSFV